LWAGETIKGKGNFQIQFDFAKFFGNEQQLYVEMYYGIPENVLTYAEDSGKFRGSADMKYEIRSDSSVVAKKEWIVRHAIEDTSILTRGQVVTGMESIGLVPGSYTLIMKAYDINNPLRNDSLVVSLPVQLLPVDKEALSDVELCSSIQSSADHGSIFYKNTLEVIPNPSRLYGLGLPILYFYMEAYNLTTRGVNTNVTVHTVVLDASGKEILVHDKPKPRLHNSSVEVGMFNLSSLKGGTYIFRADLLDSSKTLLGSSSKKFFVYRPGVSIDTSAALPSEDVATSEYISMSDKEMDQEFGWAKYLSTEAEKKQYEALSDVKAKQKFLFDFWQRRTYAASSPSTDLKQEYYKRVNFANENFSTGLREGWKTDRGRVYIVYGPSDEIERSPSSAESNPYEIWHYNGIQGGVIFVFVDRNNLDDYILVHSTHRDEIHDDSWYERYALKTQ
jgi:GWxTD domain-containing protein